VVRLATSGYYVRVGLFFFFATATFCGGGYELKDCIPHIDPPLFDLITMVRKEREQEVSIYIYKKGKEERTYPNTL
jgi:hypothetical protein